MMSTASYTSSDVPKATDADKSRNLVVFAGDNLAADSSHVLREC
jgi:hypothetical protein